MAGAGRLSTARIYILRATYLLIVAGLGVDIWPRLLLSPLSPGLAQGVVRSLLAAVTLMAAIGIWQPVKMLPLLLFELSWKSIWLAAVGLPVWFTGSMDPATWETFKACLLGLIIFPPVIPWRLVRSELAGAAGSPWKHEMIPPQTRATT
ncbi:MAG: hypothetical protein DIJKHBIC_00658 [Thermoanaerobaculia bacterium]|nr:hypothetical protein [Thermoanaerobaculia bacterium]